jgi:dTMP kinase
MTDFQSRFIVLDGPEGCGKSTQSRRLYEHLVATGHDTVLVRDPGTTRLGEQIRSVLLSPQNTDMSMRCEMLLYMAARAQLMSQVIAPALAERRLVVCDRFVSSTLAYQLDGDGLTAADISAVADVAIDHRWPDLTLILDMPPEQSFQRVRQRDKDRIEQRPLSYHQRVRANYLTQAAADPAHYRVIAADRSPDAVFADVLAAITAGHADA